MDDATTHPARCHSRKVGNPRHAFKAVDPRLHGDDLEMTRGPCAILAKGYMPPCRKGSQTCSFMAFSVLAYALNTSSLASIPSTLVASTLSTTGNWAKSDSTNLSRAA